MTSSKYTRLSVSIQMEQVIPKLGLTIVLSLALIIPQVVNYSVISDLEKIEILAEEPWSTEQGNSKGQTEISEEDDNQNPDEDWVWLLTDFDLNAYLQRNYQVPDFENVTPPPKYLTSIPRV